MPDIYSYSQDNVGKWANEQQHLDRASQGVGPIFQPYLIIWKRIYDVKHKNEVKPTDVVF
jgi:hypothetical protein